MGELERFPKTARYSPVRLLGTGGMGAVYEVTDNTSGQRLALKVMLEYNARRLLRFKQEFRAIAELSHPNLIRLFDLVCENEDDWFFTMELVEGEGLLKALLKEEGDEQTVSFPSDSDLSAVPAGPARSRASPGTLGEPACDLGALRAVLRQVLDALGYLHERGIVHRDLKPSNIIVDLHNNVRLLDFGLVRKVGRGFSTSPDGAIMGTLAYMSPEQCAGNAATPASDLYALGCIMFRLLTGRLPFEGGPVQMMQAHMERPPPRVGRRVAGVPQDIADLCRALMAKDPADRPSIDAVQAVLGLGRSDGSERTPSATSSTSQQIFVGREREMQVLEERLERAFEGEFQLVLVSGSSGLGKSTLAARLHNAARNQGFLCFSGRCYEREQVPFVAFDRAVDNMILALASWPKARLDPVRDALRDIAPIFSAIEVLCDGRAATSSEPDPRTRFQRAFDGFCRLIECCQTHAPLLFVLDDLQWSDHESIALLNALVSRHPGRVMVLGLFRPEGLSEDHPLSELGVQGHEGSGQAVSIQLEALEAPRIVQLVAEVLGEPVDERFERALSEQFEGNPFMAVLFARQLALIEPHHRSAFLETTHDIAGFLRQQIEALDGRAEALLSLAAAAGGDIGQGLLRQTSALSFDDFDVAFKDLLARRMLKLLPVRASEAASGQAERRVDLYHDRIREVAYARLDDAELHRIHRALAVAIEGQPEHIQDVEALLRHWGEAGDEAGRHRFALKAAEQAEAKLAFWRAVRLFRVALEAPERSTPQERAALNERIGRLCEYGGDFAQAAEAYQEALDFWESAPERSVDGEAALLRLRGRVCENLSVAGQLRAGREKCAQGLRSLGLSLERSMPRRILTLLWLRTLLVCAAVLPERLVQRKTTPLLQEKVAFLDLVARVMAPMWAPIAIEAAMRCELLGWQLDDKRVLQRSMAFKAAILVLLGQPSDKKIQNAHKELDRAEALARQHSLPLGREYVQFNRGMLWSAVDLERAKASNALALEGFAHLGMSNAHEGAMVRASCLMILYSKGDDDEGLEVGRAQLGLRGSHFVIDSVALSAQAFIMASRGRWRDAQEAIERQEALLAGQPTSLLSAYPFVMRSALLTMQGHFEDALSEFDRISTLQLPALGISNLSRGFWDTWVAIASVGLARQGRLTADRRSRALECLRQLGRGLSTRGVAHWGEALLYHAEGRQQAARGALNRALDVSRHNTRPHHRLLCLEAARELGAMSAGMEAEATALFQAGHKLPVGWDGG